MISFSISCGAAPAHCVWTGHAQQRHEAEHAEQDHPHGDLDRILDGKIRNAHVQR
jgi:hypothetical protein